MLAFHNCHKFGFFAHCFSWFTNPVTSQVYNNSINNNDKKKDNNNDNNNGWITNISNENKKNLKF